MGSYGGTDIGTHDDADSLAKFKNTGVYEADCDNSCCRRTLNKSGDASAEGNAFPYAAGKFFKKFCKFAAGHFSRLALSICIP